MSSAQHGFTICKSTVTNILSCDAVIASTIMEGHAYGIISFDFKAAFDKVPHKAVIEALAAKGVSGAALSWYGSFLSGRTQKVKVGNSLSCSSDVISGVVQGSCCGPGLYTLVADSLLQRIRLPHWAFADDFKIVADVAEYSCATVQEEIDKVVQWSDVNQMPLTIEKCGVMHCGSSQPRFTYFIQNRSMTVFEFDLGLVRTTGSMYEGHCQAAAAKASKISGAIRRIFQKKSPQLLWPAYCSYVLPILMYGSQAWNTTMRKDVRCIESVQRRYTKSIHGMYNLTYDEKLLQLNALNLENRRIYADMTFTYKVLHCLIKCTADELGLRLVHSRTRGDGVRLMQTRAVKRAAADIYCIRAPSVWNKLPLTITNSSSLCMFKSKLRRYLFSKQST